MNSISAYFTLVDAVASVTLSHRSKKSCILMPDCACSHSDGVTFTFRETWEGKLSRKKTTR